MLMGSNAKAQRQESNVSLKLQSGALRLRSLKHQAIKTCQFKRPDLAFVTWSSAIATDTPSALKQLKSV